jgi:hypothetical protein
MDSTTRWIATIAAALLSLAACVAAAWYALPGDLDARIGIGTSAGVVVGAVIAVWGASSAEQPEQAEDEPPHSVSPLQTRADTRVTDSAISVHIESRGSLLTLDHSPITIGATPPSPPEGKLTATVTTEPSGPARGDRTMRSPLFHDGTSARSGLTIRPAHPYLNQLRSGMELVPVPGGLWDESIPPILDVKIANNTRRTVVFHQAQLNVHRSRSRISPIPVAKAAQIMLYPSVSPEPAIHCKGSFVVNMGGPMLNCVLRFHFEHPARPGVLSDEHVLSLDGGGSPEPAPRYIKDPLLRQILSPDKGASPESESKNIDDILLRALAEAGACPQRVEPRRVDEFGTYWHWDTGPFKERSAQLVGMLEYSAPLGAQEYPETHSDTEQRNISHPLRTSLILGESDTRPATPPLHEWSGPESLLLSSARYESPALRLEGTDYSVSIPISQALAPGEADRIMIKIDALGPSWHQFSLTLLHDTGHVDCGEVSLEHYGRGGQYSPRWIYL